MIKLIGVLLLGMCIQPSFAADDISSVVLNEQKVVHTTRVVAEDDVDDAIDEMEEELFDYLEEEEITPLGEAYSSVDEVEDSPGFYEVEVGVAVDSLPDETEQFHHSALPAGEVASIIYTGPEEDLDGVYTRMEQWMNFRGYHPIHRPWAVHLSGGGIRIYWPYSRIAP